ASYALNQAAVDHARELIEGKRYVLDGDWGVVPADAAAQNAYLERHGWDAYAAWHLGLTEGATDQTKARYAFVFGDFRRVHRTGLIACVYRASEAVSSSGVVELVAPGGYDCLCVGSGAEVVSGQDVVFQGGEERLGGGVVPRRQLLPIPMLSAGLFG